MWNIRMKLWDIREASVIWIVYDGHKVRTISGTSIFEICGMH